MSELEQALSTYNLPMQIFKIMYWNHENERYENMIVKATHSMAALNVFVSKAKRDKLGWWPVPMGIEHVGELENPK